MTWIALCLAYFSLAASLHAVLRRMASGANTVVTFAAVAGACGIALLLSLLCLANLTALCIAAGVSLYAFLSELYVFAFTFVFGSVSASVLLSHLGGGEPAADDSNAAPDLMIRRRLAGLCGSGLLLEQRGSYRITTKGRFVALAERVLGAFFKHNRAAPDYGASGS